MIERLIERLGSNKAKAENNGTHNTEQLSNIHRLLTRMMKNADDPFKGRMDIRGEMKSLIEKLENP